MKLTQGKAVAAVAFLAAVACFFAVFLRLFSSEQLWGEIFAAVLGVIITAVITMILLKGQSNDDVERERAAKIFEEKLRIYEEYLRTLCDVIKGGSLSDEEKTRLEFQTAYVAMHCDPKYIEAASAAVKDLIEYAYSDNVEKLLRIADSSDTHDPLLSHLFCIVEAFRKDLYGDAFKFDDELKQSTLDNFSAAYHNANVDDSYEAKKPERIVVDLNVVSGSLVSVTGVNIHEAKPKEQQEEAARAEDTELWDAAVQKWKDKGWNVKELSGQRFRLIYQDFDDIYVMIGFLEGVCCGQAEYKGRNEFAQPLKWLKGGRVSGGAWLKELPDPYGKLPRGKLAQELKANREFQQYIIGVVNELRGYLTMHHRCTIWKEAIGERENWNIFIFSVAALACELALEEEGAPRIDIIGYGNNDIAIWLSNRKKNMDLLNKTLKRIGSQDVEIRDDVALLEAVPYSDADTVPERAKYWMERIEAT